MNVATGNASIRRPADAWEGLAANLFTAAGLEVQKAATVARILVPTDM